MQKKQEQGSNDKGKKSEKRGSKEC